jgi:hypothetical protein
MMSWEVILEIMERKRNVGSQCKDNRHNVCDVEALTVKARLARLHSLKHLDASLPASSASNSSLLPEISLLSFESNTHNLVPLVLLV